jgi:galactonate dehydratase
VSIIDSSYRTIGRRRMLATACGLLAVPFLALRSARAAVPALRVRGFELIPVRATSRTVWLFVRLQTDAGLTGLGEASDAFGFANTTRENVDAMRAQLATFVRMIEGRSPLDVAAFRQQAMPVARMGLVAATAFSALEQALWDLTGKALGVPVHRLFGGTVRAALPVYANINRATTVRTPEGFAATARRAVAEGFLAIKAAPWDGFPAPASPAAQIEKAIDDGIAAVIAMREAVGPRVAVMVDCHSFFSVEQAVRIARRLEPQALTWYEEPVAPENVASMLEIKRRIPQPMAAGELLFGVSGFAPLVRQHAVDVIMPDVKHCGGLLELTHIAAEAASENLMVAPHNPSGPVSTAASAQVCAALSNVNYLELQYGEVGWRGEMIAPAERFVDGQITIGDRPGLGIELNDAAITSHALPV